MQVQAIPKQIRRKTYKIKIQRAVSTILLVMEKSFITNDPFDVNGHDVYGAYRKRQSLYKMDIMSTNFYWCYVFIYLLLLLLLFLSLSFIIVINFIIYLFFFFFLFLLIWVFFHEHSRITGLQKKGESISLTPHYHFHPLHRHLDISRAITAESSPLHIASSRTRTRNL